MAIHNNDDQWEITFGSVWVMRNLCLDSCSLNRAALTNGTDWSGKPPPSCMPAVMQAVRRSVYALLMISAWLWSIVTFCAVSRRKPRRRPRTVGRALAAPLSWVVPQQTTHHQHTTLGAFFIVTSLTWAIPSRSFLPTGLAPVSPIVKNCGTTGATGTEWETTLAQPITSDVYNETGWSRSFSTFIQSQNC